MSRACAPIHPALLLVLIVLPACSATPPPPDGDTIRAHVDAAFAELVSAVQSLDIDHYLTFFDRERFTALNADGTVVHTFAEFAHATREQLSGIRAYESLAFDRVKITVVNETTAILVNEYRATVVLMSGETATAAGAGTQVWSAASGDWKLLHVASSVHPER